MVILRLFQLIGDSFATARTRTAPTLPTTFRLNTCCDRVEYIGTHIIDKGDTKYQNVSQIASLVLGDTRFNAIEL